jgi:hypothetical protein
VKPTRNIFKVNAGLWKPKRPVWFRKNVDYKVGEDSWESPDPKERERLVMKAMEKLSGIVPIKEPKPKKEVPEKSDRELLKELQAKIKREDDMEYRMKAVAIENAEIRRKHKRELNSERARERIRQRIMRQKIMRQKGGSY